MSDGCWRGSLKCPIVLQGKIVHKPTTYVYWDFQSVDQPFPWYPTVCPVEELPVVSGAPGVCKMPKCRPQKTSHLKPRTHFVCCAGEGVAPTLHCDHHVGLLRVPTVPVSRNFENPTLLIALPHHCAFSKRNSFALFIESFEKQDIDLIFKHTLKISLMI